MKKTFLPLVLLGCSVAGLQGGDYMDKALAYQANINAVLTAPVPAQQSKTDALLAEQLKAIRQQNEILQLQEYNAKKNVVILPVPTR